MGNICKNTVLLGVTDNYQKITNDDFVRDQIIDENGLTSDYIIGSGGFATVYRVTKKDDPNPKSKKLHYAMKTMKKIEVSQQKNIQSTMNEMFLLSEIENIFIIDMKWAFHDEEQLYLIMKELKGKDLRFHMNHYKLKDDLFLKQRQKDLESKREAFKQKIINFNGYETKQNKDKPKTEESSFTENQTRFLISQICLALQYLHNKQIIHRDIKPENILFEENGYLKLTDLGIAKKYKPNNNIETSGTPGYMAPEVLCRQNHNYAVDYYAVGVIAFELMFNKRPYQNEDDKKENFRKDLLSNILESQIKVVPYRIEKNARSDNKECTEVEAPQNWSVNGIDFINQRKPTERIGYKDVNEVLKHPWFNKIDFKILGQRKYKPPFNEIHINRSIERNRIIKFIEEEIKKIEIQIDQKREMEEMNKKKQNINQNPDDSDNDDFYTQRDETPKIFQQQQLSQERQEKENNHQKLKSIEHFFKSYYFDRERFKIEIAYFQERKALERGKQIQSALSNKQQSEIQMQQYPQNNNLNDKSYQNNKNLSPHKQQLEYSQNDVLQNADETFPAIEYIVGVDQNQNEDNNNSDLKKQKSTNNSNPLLVQNNIRSYNNSVSQFSAANTTDDTYLSKSTLHTINSQKSSKISNENKSFDITSEQKGKSIGIPQININLSPTKQASKKLLQTRAVSDFNQFKL